MASRTGSRNKAGRRSNGAAAAVQGFDQSPRVRADAGGLLPPMVTYAQNFEDVILRRVLQDVAVGFYVDIGAWDPTLDSVTAWFYSCGWRGVNVEPMPRYFEALLRERPRDINLAKVVGSGGGLANLAVLDDTGLSSAISGARTSLARHRLGTPRVIPVPKMTLEAVLALAKERVIDFLKIDAEGMEGEILASAEFKRARPRIVVVEATAPMTQLPSHQQWEPGLLARGYVFTVFDGLNRFYLRAEDGWRRPMFDLPPCVFDNFTAPTRALHLRERLEPLERSLRRSEDQIKALKRQLRRTRRRGSARAG